MHSSREQNMVLGSLNPTFSPRILDLTWSVARPRSVVPALCLCPLLVSGLYVEQHRQRGPGERLVAMKDSQTVGSERPSDSCTEVSQLLQSLCLPVCLSICLSLPLLSFVVKPSLPKQRSISPNSYFLN